MSAIADMHDRAMNLLDEAYIARRQGESEQAISLIREALDLEISAANTLRDDLSAEPSRSILYRSAASIAIEVGEHRTAERLIATALSGNPPQIIVEELRDLLQEAVVQSRQIKQVKMTRSIPVVGVIASGQPLPDFSVLHSPKDYPSIEVATTLLPAYRQRNVVGLLVQGDVLIDALISDEDLILFQPQSAAKEGDLVAIRLIEENAITLKKYFVEGERVRLQSVNPFLQPIYTELNNSHIIGRVVAVVRTMVAHRHESITLDAAQHHIHLAPRLRPATWVRL